MPDWDPNLYLKFGNERTQPAIDLASRITVATPRNVIDLGCGPGNSTAILRTRWPEARIIGLDNDPAMLAAAARTDREVTWVQADVATWRPPDQYDVVFSNAALQWISDHGTLIPRLFAIVAPGGALAVQIPTHLKSMLHQQILQVAEEPAWRAQTRTARGALMMHDPVFYYDLLCACSSKLELWETEYCHVLDNPQAILTWIRGTGLRPFLAALDDDEQRRRFETALLERIAASYPPRLDGKLLFPFRRLFFIANK